MRIIKSVSQEQKLPNYSCWKNCLSLSHFARIGVAPPRLVTLCCDQSSGIRSCVVKMDQTWSRGIPSLCWIFPFDQLEMFGDNYDKIESAHDMNVTTINSTTGGYEVHANYTFMVSTTCIRVLVGCVLWVSSYSCYFWEDNLSWLCSQNFKLHLHLLCTWIMNACQISIILA